MLQAHRLEVLHNRNRLCNTSVIIALTNLFPEHVVLDRAVEKESNPLGIGELRGVAHLLSGQQRVDAFEIRARVLCFFDVAVQVEHGMEMLRGGSERFETAIGLGLPRVA